MKRIQLSMDADAVDVEYVESCGPMASVWNCTKRCLKLKIGNVTSAECLLGNSLDRLGLALITITFAAKACDLVAVV